MPIVQVENLRHKMDRCLHWAVQSGIHETRTWSWGVILLSPFALVSTVFRVYWKLFQEGNPFLAKNMILMWLLGDAFPCPTWSTNTFRYGRGFGADFQIWHGKDWMMHLKVFMVSRSSLCPGRTRALGRTCLQFGGSSSLNISPKHLQRVLLQ